MVTTNETLKTQIKTELAQHSPVSDEFIAFMLEHIGDLDPVLRDEIIYSGWISLLEKNRWSVPQKQFLLKAALSQDFLFKDIQSEKLTDAVFTRSFSALLLVLLIADHNLRPWLTQGDKKEILNAAIDYMNQEKDNRGLVEGKGWAHAFAHGADLLGALNSLDILTSKDISDILSCMKRGLIDIENFLYGEDSRFSYAILEFLKAKKLDEETLSNWIDQENSHLKEGTIFNICWDHFLLTLTTVMKIEEINMPKVETAAMDFFQWNYRTFS